MPTTIGSFPLGSIRPRTTTSLRMQYSYLSSRTDRLSISNWESSENSGLAPTLSSSTPHLQNELADKAGHYLFII